MQLACTCYMQAHPDMVTYRTRVVPHYNELCIICGHAVADGRYSLSCFDVDFEKNDEGIECRLFINFKFCVI